MPHGRARDTRWIRRRRAGGRVRRRDPGGCPGGRRGGAPGPGPGRRPAAAVAGPAKGPDGGWCGHPGWRGGDGPFGPGGVRDLPGRGPGPGGSPSRAAGHSPGDPVRGRGPYRGGQARRHGGPSRSRSSGRDPGQRPAAPLRRLPLRDRRGGETRRRPPPGQGHLGGDGRGQDRRRPPGPGRTG